MGMTLSPRAARQLGEVVRKVGTIENDGSHRSRGAALGGSEVRLVRVTSTTATSGRYPGKLLSYDAEAASYTDLDDVDIWVVAPDGATPSVARHLARRSGYANGRSVWHLTGPAGGAGSSGGSSTYASRDEDGILDYGQRSLTTESVAHDGQQEIGGKKAFVHGINIGPAGGLDAGAGITDYGGQITFNSAIDAESYCYIEGRGDLTNATLTLHTEANSVGEAADLVLFGGDNLVGITPTVNLYVTSGSAKVTEVRMTPSRLDLDAPIIGFVNTFGSTSAFPSIEIAHDGSTLSGDSGTDALGNVFTSGLCTTVGSGSASGVTSVTLTQPAAGLTITGSGVAITSTGTPTFALANDLAAVEGLSGTGFAERTGADTWTTRTLVVGDLPELHGFTNATPGDADRFPFYKDSTGNRDCAASELADYVLSTLVASDLPALNGFTNATPADDDRFPFYDDGAAANRDCSALNLKTYCNPLIVLRDEKTQNTDAGTFTSGAWRTRDLNTESVDTDGNCTLSSNQFTLTAGTYEIFATAPAALVNRHQIRLQNVTDGTTILTGRQAISGATDNTQTDSVLAGRFTVAASKALEIQHQCQTTAATFGFGLAGNFTTEVYTVVVLRKVA